MLRRKVGRAPVYVDGAFVEQVVSSERKQQMEALRHVTH